MKYDSLLKMPDELHLVDGRNVVNGMHFCNIFFMFLHTSSSGYKTYGTPQLTFVVCQRVKAQIWESVMFTYIIPWLPAEHGQEACQTS
jgi:hypothetical protein